MVLITFVKLDKIAAPSPDTDNQVSVQFRMLLGVKQLFSVEGVQLQLVAALADVVADEHRKLLDGLVVAEDALIKFDGQWSSVDDILQLWLAERAHHRHRALMAKEHTWGEVGRDNLSCRTSVRSCRQSVGMEHIVHGCTGTCTPDATALVALTLQALDKRSEQLAADSIRFLHVHTHLRSLVTQAVLKILMALEVVLKRICKLLKSYRLVFVVVFLDYSK